MGSSTRCFNPQSCLLSFLLCSRPCFFDCFCRVSLLSGNYPVCALSPSSSLVRFSVNVHLSICCPVVGFFVSLFCSGDREMQASCWFALLILDALSFLDLYLVNFNYIKATSTLFGVVVFCFVGWALGFCNLSFSPFFFFFLSLSLSLSLSCSLSLSFFISFCHLFASCAACS